MSIQSRFATSAEAKKAGWFSRRHQTESSSRMAREDHRLAEHRVATELLARHFERGVDKRAGRPHKITLPV